MPKLPSISTNSRGQYVIRSNNHIIGILIPAGDDKFTLRIGEFGGYSNTPQPFNEALNNLIEWSIRSYTRSLRSAQVSANLIYKKKSSSLTKITEG